MYNQYFHFSEQPFSIAPDPHFMYMSARHQEGLAHLLYGITFGGGFVALTGEVGTGKTTLCHCLLQELPENVDIALILNPKMNASELLATICDELSIAYDKQQLSLKSLVDNLNQYLLQAHAKGRRTVLLIDEAQNLSMEVLEQIRLLTNLETSKTKLLQIILVGQPELKQMLGRRNLRQLNQRITARYHLLPLTLKETRAYIEHRLEMCNGNPELFKDKAIRLIYKLSSGVPRLINILCDRALLGAYAKGVQSVSTRLVESAAKEALAPPKRNNRRWLRPLLLALLSLMVYGLYQFHAYYQKTSPQALKTSTKNPAEALPSRKVAETTHFSDWLANSRLTLNSAIGEGLKQLVKSPPIIDSDCSKLPLQDIYCLPGKGTWKDLLAINRPAILEFTLSNGNKRYVWLSHLRNEQAVLQYEKENTFPLSDVLGQWDGNYLFLWHSPVPGMKSIFPGQNSDQVLWLREKLNFFDGDVAPVAQPSRFDSALSRRLKNFQRQHQLVEDGIAGLQSLFYLDNLSTANTAPRLLTRD